MEDRLKKIVRKVLDAWLEEFADEATDDNRGGYFAYFMPNGTGGVFSIGEATPERFAGTLNNAVNKVMRLVRNTEHFTAFESAVPEAVVPTYGGGIRIPETAIIAFSGLPALADEALCIAVAEEAFGLDVELYLRVVTDREKREERNPFIDRLRARLVA